MCVHRVGQSEFGESPAGPLSPKTTTSRSSIRPRSALTTAFLATLCAAVAAAADERPNIVFILADDLGSHDVGWRGGKLPTPQLDRLARGGASLEQFYVQPVCTPTRTCLMTGRYPMRCGLQVGVIRPQAQYGLPLAERTLAAALRDAGYATAITGKWHLGSFDEAYWPGRRGFDRSYGHLFGAIDYHTHRRDGKLDWYRDGKSLEESGYSTHLLAREAVDVIRRHDSAKPLFLYVPFNAVHAPHQVPASYKEPFSQLPEPRRTYAGMLAALDEAVGQIISALDEKKLRERTLIVFSSDNGGPQPGKVTDNGPLRAGKGTLYEGGVRVCAFAHWPAKIPAGTKVEQPLHMVDWYPTLLKLAGAKLEQPLPIDGRDLWDAVTKNQKSPHEHLLLNFTPRDGAIRAGQWKLIAHDLAAPTPKAPNAKKKKANQAKADDESIELYDLATDIGETKNLASRQPERVAELRRLLVKYHAEQVPPRNTAEAE